MKVTDVIIFHRVHTFSFLSAGCGEKIVDKIHHKHCSVFCCLLIYIMDMINARKLEHIKTTGTIHEDVATDYGLDVPVFESR